jgi:hypothetical protein
VILYPPEHFRACVMPCATQRDAVLRRRGILKDVSACNGPVSAERHFMPRRTRDDAGSEAIEPLRFDPLKLYRSFS